ncbi:MAG: hypothetical protein KJ622_05825 [Alphaproteobacteria bacterium]|nr:hypothetical protein [Alphaproteobacteria bacterium]
MQAGILGDLRRFGLDVLVGLAIFSVLAMLLLGGEPPRDLPQVSEVLSIKANAADYRFTGGLGKPELSPMAAETKPFRFTDGWSALSVMAAMFALIYAFNLALFRRFAQSQARVIRRRL